MTDAMAPAAATILVVDDMPANLRLVANLLEKYGYTVAVAQDGREALKRAELIQPDLILLDVMMPDMDGIETVRRLKFKEATKDIPVIFMTALDAERDKVVGFVAGGVDYVTKPFQIAELMARIDHQLALRSARRALEEKNQTLQLELRSLEETVTALRRSCREGEVSEEGYQALLALLPVAVLIHGEGKVQFANAAALRLLGAVAETDLVGSVTLSWLPTAARQDVDGYLKQVQMSAGLIQSLIQPICRLDGLTLAIELSGAPVRYHGMAAVALLLREVSPQKL